MKLLTVTVPCYNSQAYMEKCVQSLLVGGDRVEIILVDDGSKDRTGEIADRFAALYPERVLAIHQKNGGHGEGINQGLRYATGKYFKTVDSDDWLSDDFPRFLDQLEECDRNGGVDLFVTNYHYHHADGKGDRSIIFSNALPEGRIFTWSETKPFRIDQILMIHACTFRTGMLRQTGLEMPKHTFYEDNYMVYGNLQAVERMFYRNADLYCYFIGREGQSVQEDVMMRRYIHQIRAMELCFRSFHLDEITDQRKKAYLRHELLIMFGIAVLFTRLNRTEQAEYDLKQMWDSCYAFDPKWAACYRRHFLLRLICVPGRRGIFFVKSIYKLAHAVVRFN
ncbi:MAG: glycosyltransferase family 2 protein [Oscillospiraceae bacterium]|nr:glycosyltransferase family 2 protein [Oscillospiraceae bacterium]